MTARESMRELITTKDWKHIPEASLYYKLYMVDEDAHILFRGTTGTLKDWLVNFRFLRTPYRGAKWRAHKGFVESYKAVQPIILQYIKAKQPRMIFISGYSQGAAIATLAHEDLTYHGYLPITHAFASPRVVGWGADRKYWRNVVRYSMPRDIVTKLPLRIMGYKHVGQEMTIAPGWRWPPSVKQHRPEQYIENL